MSLSAVSPAPRTIRSTAVPTKQSKQRNLIFPNSALAHHFCTGIGIEIGAAAHNPFHLPGCLNLALPDDFETYKNAQTELCDRYAEVDLWGDAGEVERYVAAGSLDYLVSSHVFQLHPKPLSVLRAWTRVLKPGGIIFLIIPKRDADPLTREHPLTPMQTLIGEGGQPTSKRVPHAYVYTLGTLLALIGALNHRIAPQEGVCLTVRAALETDDKVGNGHCLVLRKDSWADGARHSRN